MKELKEAFGDNMLLGIKITLTSSYLAFIRLKRHSKNEFALWQISFHSISFNRG